MYRPAGVTDEKPEIVPAPSLGTMGSAFGWYFTAKSLANALGKAVAGALLTLTASNFTAVFLVTWVISSLTLPGTVRPVRLESLTYEKVPTSAISPGWHDGFPSYTRRGPVSHKPEG